MIAVSLDGLCRLLLYKGWGWDCAEPCVCTHVVLHSKASTPKQVHQLCFCVPTLSAPIAHTDVVPHCRLFIVFLFHTVCPLCSAHHSQVLGSFQEQLLALNSEKEQRGLIKTLLAETGGQDAGRQTVFVPCPPHLVGQAQRSMQSVGWQETSWQMYVQTHLTHVAEVVHMTRCPACARCVYACICLLWAPRGAICHTVSHATSAVVVAAAGGDSARAVLSAVSKVGAPVTNMGDAKPKREMGSTADELRWDWSEAGIAL